MLTKRGILLLALLSILFLPSIAMAQANGLAVVDDDGKTFGPVVGVPGGEKVMVYYVGDPSEATYFQFKNYVFIEIAPLGFFPTDGRHIYWTLVNCQGDPYTLDPFPEVFDSISPWTPNDPALSDLVLPLDPDQTRVLVHINGSRDFNGDCRDRDNEELNLIAVESFNLDFTLPFALVEIGGKGKGPKNR